MLAKLSDLLYGHNLCMVNFYQELAIVILELRASERKERDDAQSIRRPYVPAISCCPHLLHFNMANGIQFEEIKIDLAEHHHLSAEFKEINPMRQVPAIVDGRFKLFESHAILIYLACAFPGVADHWYPSDLFKRAKINSVLDWHHSNLRRGAAPFVLYSTLAPALGIPLNPIAAAEAEKILSASLAKIETIWLKGSGCFLLGSLQPSIADISLVCEIMQLELVDEKDRNRILGPHKEVLKWIEDTKNATQPHFDELHSILFKVRGSLQQLRQAGTNTGTQSKL